MPGPSRLADLCISTGEHLAARGNSSSAPCQAPQQHPACPGHQVLAPIPLTVMRGRTLEQPPPRASADGDTSQGRAEVGGGARLTPASFSSHLPFLSFSAAIAFHVLTHARPRPVPAGGQVWIRLGIRMHWGCTGMMPVPSRLLLRAQEPESPHACSDGPRYYCLKE